MSDETEEGESGADVYRETVPEALAGERADRMVAFITGCSRSEAAMLIEAAAVQRNGRPVKRGSERLAVDDEVIIDTALLVGQSLPTADPDVAFGVLHADDDLIVIDKPAGLVVHPGSGNRSGTLVNGLLARFPELASVGDPVRPGIVHRLDRGTSGVLAVARTPAAYESLVEQFRTRTAGRRYLTLVWGHLASDRGVIDARLGRSRRQPLRRAVVADGREARTHYEVTSRHDHPVQLSRLTCHLETGRTHQIRAHLSAIDHPVVGDELYGGARVALPFGRPALHAASLSLEHPSTGERCDFEAPLPDDLVSLFAGLS